MNIIVSEEQFRLLTETLARKSVLSDTVFVTEEPVHQEPPLQPECVMEPHHAGLPELYPVICHQHVKDYHIPLTAHIPLAA